MVAKKCPKSRKKRLCKNKRPLPFIDKKWITTKMVQQAVGGAAPAPAPAAITRQFRFSFTMSRELRDDNYIRSARIDLSSFESYVHTITFDTPVSEEVAIARVEAYFSEPLTREYFYNLRQHEHDFVDAVFEYEDFVNANMNISLIRADMHGGLDVYPWYIYDIQTIEDGVVMFDMEY